MTAFFLFILMESLCVEHVRGREENETGVEFFIASSSPDIKSVELTRRSSTSSSLSLRKVTRKGGINTGEKVFFSFSPPWVVYLFSFRAIQGRSLL